MFRSIARYLPGIALAIAAAVLFSRAGYGPFGEPAQRGRPCTPTRCRHNATTLLGAAIALLVHAFRHHRQDQLQATSVA